MKKLMLTILVILAVCLWAAASIGETAEANGAALLENSWVSETDEDYTVDIFYEDGAFDLLSTRFVSDTEVYCVEFEKCVWDEATGALICEGGILTHETSVEDETQENGEEEDEEADEEEEETDLVEVIASGFGATLTLDADGRLHWTGSGDAVADQVFIIEEAEEDGLFTGDWESGDFWILIEMHRGIYDVTVQQDVNDDQLIQWDYICTPDPESGALTGTGTKMIVYMDEDDGTETEAYTDGKATFTLDGGALIWNDEKEDAGKGLVFARSAEEEPDEDEEAEVDEEAEEESDIQA